MPTENHIDCPALHERSSSYPFGERVPLTVRMLKTVTADPMPGIGLSYIKGDPPVARSGETYPVWTNSHGAVVAILDEGKRLGLRPAEFEVDTWHDLATGPAPQHHAEPIAWMVGTAFWRTKEEAERDSAATGLPIVGLGPMTGVAPAEQHQGEPVAWLYSRSEGQVEPVVTLNKASASDRGSWDETPLYTHADPGEVERLRTVIEQQRSLIASLREELVESRSIDARAEPGPTIWNCRPCQLEQPTDRPRDVCGGKTGRAGAKS